MALSLLATKGRFGKPVRGQAKGRSDHEQEDVPECPWPIVAHEIPPPEQEQREGNESPSSRDG